ncbi:3-oxoacyl-ACP reductase (plasmid) [Streptomyces clavuligerus]|nr:3-oxoacyl-ACP reductase [Streptomyces clavuligerus]AXU17555.1 3-oxoacyl-ACP reductase FabG [Streptomyces clavuligerus]QCS10958.1 3-oxoacyl-ACP reductase FabG [Streptomyces clavuligerus]QPJ98450.1 3-oxoacyl-ACP reductase FabG [Streptomyces clavuligerus]
MMTFTPWEGRSVVVTGGTRGIGRGIAELFARQGAAVLLTGRDGETARGVAGDLARATGGTVAGMGVDLREPEAIEEMAAEAVRLHGGIDVLCANAGVFTGKPLREMTAADVDEMLDVNLRGSILAARACLPAMERAGRGRIVLTSSITGPRTGFAGWSHYGASKAGQLGFVRSAALETAPYGITVNAVLPGNVRTEGLVELGEEYMRGMTASIPLGRLGETSDIAHAVLFLASDEAAFITGQTLVVDGGQTLPESLEALALPRS